MIRYRGHHIYVAQPDPSSWAAALLLDRQFRPKPKSFRIWLKYRKWWLRSQKRLFKILKCFYCGKGPLFHNSLHEETLATIDHFIPRSRGGAEYDTKNFRVACSPCNSKKKDDLIIE